MSTSPIPFPFGNAAARVRDRLTELRRSRLSASLLDYLEAKTQEHSTPGAQEHVDERERTADWWLTRMGVKRLHRALENLAVSAVVFGSAAFRDKLASILEVMIDQNVLDRTAGTNYGRPYTFYHPLDAGSTAVSLSIALEAMSELHDDDLLRRAATYVRRVFDFLVANELDPALERPDWNIAIIGAAGCGTLARTLRELGVVSDPEHQNAVERAKRHVRAFLERGHDDGVFLEGAGYGCGTLHHCAPLVWALLERGDEELALHPAWSRAAAALAGDLIPGRVEFNPANDTPSRVWTVDWLCLPAHARADRIAAWLWRTLVGAERERQEWESPELPWTGLATRYLLFHLSAAADDPAPPPPRELPFLREFRKRGMVSMRSGWGEQDTLLSFLCDTSAPSGHRQADRNHFSLHALGESFAVDSGYALESIPGTTEVLRLGALGCSHNLPLVNGEMQHKGHLPSGGIRRTELGSPFRYVEAEAGEGYLGAERFTRRLAVLCATGGGTGDRLTPADAVCVADVVTLRHRGNAFFSWLLHTDSGNAVELLDADTCLIRGVRGHASCLLVAASPWFGRWRQEAYCGHTRLAYETEADLLAILVLLLPFQTASPRATVHRSDGGCSVTAFRADGGTDRVVSARPGRTAELDGVETDAELAVLRLAPPGQGGGLESWMIAGGSTLRLGAHRPIAEAQPVPFSASPPHRLAHPPVAR